MGDLGPLLAHWRAHDELFERVEPTSWGAVVSDRRFPAVRDVNYARVEAERPVRLGEVEAHLLPAIRGSGAETVHTVVFRPEAQSGLVAEASTRGDRLSWDLVMAADPTSATPDVGEEETTFDDGFWRTVAESVRVFGVSGDDELDQVLALQREVLLPAGRRWFTVRERGRRVALAALLVLDGVGMLDHVVTFPRARRRGFAEALTRRALAAAGGAGARHVVLLADPQGPAVRIYERCGFEPTGHLASWVSTLDRQTG